MQGWEAYHTCTHTLTPSISPWESTANSALILCHCFLPYVFFCNLPIMLNTVKISTHSHLVLVPSSIMCVQLNKRPKPLNECTGWGAQGGERCKNTDVRVPPETSSLHLLSLEQATCHSSDSSPSPPLLDPKAGPMLLLLNLESSKRVWEVHKHHPGTVWVWSKTGDATNLH